MNWNPQGGGGEEEEKSSMENLEMSSRRRDQVHRKEYTGQEAMVRDCGWPMLLGRIEGHTENEND